MNELELFNYLKLVHIPDLIQAEQYDAWDCVSGRSRIYIELKSRNTHYDTLLIEKPKYEQLKIKAMRKGFTAWYINSTPMGIWAFNLSKIPRIEWHPKELPRYTTFTNKDKIIKQVAYLSIADGIRML